jgi:AcrR family transcriptional regulator
MPYHHGDLRRALLDTALEAVAEQGPATISLRDVARRAGVSHAAPTHHFGDKTGLLTALAAEGWSLLADALAEASEQNRSFAELGVTYVVFATAHPAHFAVMRAPGLVRGDDPALAAAQQRAGEQLQAGASSHDRGTTRETTTTALAGWALVHGLSALLVEGMVRPEPGTDVATLARSVTARLRPGG